MPIKSGAMQRPRDCRCGNTFRQRYDEVGLPCSSTMGSPSPTSTYAISLPRICRRCFRYGNAAEIVSANPVLAVDLPSGAGMERSGTSVIICASLVVVELAILTREEDASVRRDALG